MADYFPRVADAELADLMRASGAVLIEGPKACVKDCNCFADRRRGLYLLTGSATPKDDTTRHSGAGRFGVLRMRPMSLFESGHSTGEVSLAALLEGYSQPGRDNGMAVPGLMERVVIGGWPDLLDNSETWQPHMRSRARLRTTATRYFVAPQSEQRPLASAAWTS